ncbi:MAG TPA: flagellar biosynthetic protein FliO [Parachlamydiaceae bacterium]|nr:flagellar biosynthetic protein FliO [Parachlamydiaceae bacterium]
MKKSIKNIYILLAVLFLAQGIAFAADTSPAETPTEQQGLHKAKVPDFSPPTDLTGPVFPFEDIYGEPAPETNRFWSEVVNMMATLGLIISLILIVAWFLKRMLNTRQEQVNTTSIIKVIERRALSPKTVIYLLEIEGKSMVISESQNGVTYLTNYNSPVDEEEVKKLPSAFNKLLNQGRTDSK